MKRIKTIHIVSDVFAEFARHHDDVFTISEMEIIVELALRHHRLHDFRDTVLLIGQGVPRDEAFALRDRLTAQGLSADVLASETGPAPLAQTHKHRLENVLISSPFRHSEHHFVFDLLIDERCADISDHLTGEHVPAMVLIEAARQCLIVTWEKYYLSRDPGEYRVILEDIEGRFTRFLFPLPIKIHIQVSSWDHRKRGCHRFVAEVAFCQNAQQPACTVTFRYSVRNASYLKSRERQLAQKALQTFKLQGRRVAA